MITTINTYYNSNRLLKNDWSTANQKYAYFIREHETEIFEPRDRVMHMYYLLLRHMVMQLCLLSTLYFIASTSYDKSIAEADNTIFFYADLVIRFKRIEHRNLCHFQYPQMSPFFSRTAIPLIA